MTESKFLAYAGHINVDVVMSVDKLTDDITNSVSSVEEQFGGTAGNFAIVASKLGYPFRIYSTVSRKSHDSYIHYLKGLKINLDGITIKENGYGPICYAVNDGKKQKYFMAEGPMTGIRYNIQDEHYGYLHLSTGDPETNMDLLERSIHDRAVFDPSQEIFYKYDREQIQNFVKKSDIIMGNSDEINYMKVKGGISLEQEISSGKIFIETKGQLGTLLHGKKESLIHSINATGKVNTLGAGDSFRAGFYFGLFRNMDFEHSIACGNVVAYESVTNGLMNISLTEESIIRRAKMLCDNRIP
ncbi:MAG: PfkB family carbohydrate kinase [Candidatus Thermoplasmatota archaeon]|nr:PfkB family carbohydrate kinase [Candidatus Thermoplasmatota archaeon]